MIRRKRSKKLRIANLKRLNRRELKMGRKTRRLKKRKRKKELSSLRSRSRLFKKNSV
jgi:hypothetical protein